MTKDVHERAVWEPHGEDIFLSELAVVVVDASCPAGSAVNRHVAVVVS